MKAMKATPKAATQEHPCFLSLAGYDLFLAVSVQPLCCKKTCHAHTLTLSYSLEAILAQDLLDNVSKN